MGEVIRHVTWASRFSSVCLFMFIAGGAGAAPIDYVEEAGFSALVTLPRETDATPGRVIYAIPKHVRSRFAAYFYRCIFFEYERDGVTRHFDLSFAFQKLSRYTHELRVIRIPDASNPARNIHGFLVTVAFSIVEVTRFTLSTEAGANQALEIADAYGKYELLHLFPRRAIDVPFEEASPYQSSRRRCWRDLLRSLF